MVSGPQLTSEAFQFLDKYSIGTITDDEGASPRATPRRVRRGKRYQSCHVTGGLSSVGSVQ